MTERKVNSNPPHSPPSAEELAQLQDPRVLAMREPNRNFPETHIVFEPREPIVAPSRFLTVRTDWSGRTSRRAEWQSWPDMFGKGGTRVGLGSGFGGVSERPSVFQNVARPSKPPQVWANDSLSSWLVVSPQVCDVFCRYDADSLEFCAIDWEYRDGTRLEGYGLLDVINLLPAYDYARSRIDVKWSTTLDRHLVFQTPTVLRADIPPDVHFFREERWRRLYVSQELAAELAPFAAKDLLFMDPHSFYRVVEFNTRRRRMPQAAAPPPAIVHDLPSVTTDRFAQRMRSRTTEIELLLDAGDFAAVEDKLSGWLRELPESPLHVAIEPGVAIDTPAAVVAEYLDDFVAEAAKQGKPEVIYAELNDFAINPDAWFFDLFSFDEDGGREEYDWLGSFSVAATDRCFIRGLEALQSVYDDLEENAQLLKGHDEARRLVALLVIVRFQRLLQEALAIASCKLPLLAGAHDQGDEYTVEIRRPQSD